VAVFSDQIGLGSIIVAAILGGPATVLSWHSITDRRKAKSGAVREAEKAKELKDQQQVIADFLHEQGITLREVQKQTVPLNGDHTLAESVEEIKVAVERVDDKLDRHTVDPRAHQVNFP
jgi:hypothetical protein